MIKANEFFINTLKRVLESENRFQPTRAKYADGVQAKTKSIYNISVSYDIEKGEFPIQTIRKTPIKDAISEMLWIYTDESNDLKLLNEKYGVKYWNNWDVGDGTIGNCYGYTVDKYGLMGKLLYGISRNILSKRHMINLWQEEDMSSNNGLIPCAGLTRFMFQEVGKNQYHMYVTLHQRSSDFITASSINQIQYVALGMIIEDFCNRIYQNVVFKNFTWIVDDLHIYDRHIDLAHQLIKDAEKCDDTQYNIEVDITYKKVKDCFKIPKINFINNTKIEVAI